MSNPVSNKPFSDLSIPVLEANAEGYTLALMFSCFAKHKDITHVPFYSYAVSWFEAVESGRLKLNERKPTREEALEMTEGVCKKYRLGSDNKEEERASETDKKQQHDSHPKMAVYEERVQHLKIKTLRYREVLEVFYSDRLTWDWAAQEPLLDGELIDYRAFKELIKSETGLTVPMTFLKGNTKHFTRVLCHAD